MSLEREIAIALNNAERQGYQELRIDIKTRKITPIRRGVGIRVDRREHVTITRIIDTRR